MIAMCGRYVLFSDTEEQEIWDIIDEVQRKTNGEIKTGEIYPTDKVPILIQRDSVITPEAVKWGFPNFQRNGVIINARAETVQEKPMFRRSLESKRCVIPSTGFYEWSHDGKKIKYRFNLPDTEILYMAGLYNEFDGQPCFVILTTGANRSMVEIHNRMPVVLNKDGVSDWMADESVALHLLDQEPPQLVRQPA